MMKKTIAVLCTALMTAGTLGFAPASAAPLQLNGAQVMNAQMTFGYNSGNNWNDRNHRDRGRFERRGKSYFYNGHRGYRDRRPGWRQYNGFWFPPSAFSFGIIISPSRGRVSLSAQHRAWCEDRYISYRASDNTFQPYNGPRQECVSPYYR